MDRFKIFTNDPTAFPADDVRAFIDRLHANGQKVVFIVDPGVKIEPGYSTYEDLIANDLYLRDSSGQPTVGKVWAGPSVFPDWNHPNATEFWSAQIRRFLTEFPIDGEVHLSAPC